MPVEGVTARGAVRETAGPGSKTEAGGTSAGVGLDEIGGAAVDGRAGTEDDFVTGISSGWDFFFPKMRPRRPGFFSFSGAGSGIGVGAAAMLGLFGLKTRFLLAGSATGALVCGSSGSENRDVAPGLNSPVETLAAAFAGAVLAVGALIDAGTVDLDVVAAALLWGAPPTVRSSSEKTSPDFVSFTSRR